MSHQAVHRPAPVPAPSTAAATAPDAGVGRSAQGRRQTARTGRAADREDTTCTSTVDPADATSAASPPRSTPSARPPAPGSPGLLYKLLSGGFGDQLLKTLFDHVLGLLGIG